MHIKVFTKTKCFAMHMMTCPVLGFKTPGVLHLAVRSFKHCGDLGDLWRLLEPSELISGHGQVGAWGLADVVAIVL